MTTAAITIDVDSIAYYRAIHGLDAGARGVEDDPVYTLGVPRFFDLLEDAQVPATLFLIGADAPAHASAFSRIGSTGSEVASHSMHHDYRMIELPPAAIERDLRASLDALAPLAGGRPVVGFRAPGYNVSRALLEAAMSVGCRWDSSLLPSPWYWGARWAAIRAYAFRGRPSRSLAGDRRQFSGPLEPYRTAPEAPWTPRPDGPLVEIPMACDPTSRMPLIGTTWAALPELAQGALLRSALRRLSVFNFEMHAIDLLDRSDHPALEELASSQTDLRISARKKVDAFRRLFKALKERAAVTTLGAIAAQVS